MGLFSRKSKASRDEVARKSKASPDDRSMNRSASASAQQTRGRTDAIAARSQAPISAPASPRRYFSRSRNASTEVFYTTDPEAPPIPQAPQFKYDAVPVPPRNPRRSTGSDYYSSRTIAAPSYDNNSMLRHKPSEQGQPQMHYADSGYESNGSYSALHSRVPSEHNYMYHEEPKQGHSRSGSDYLPELKLGGGSLSESILSVEPQPTHTSNDSYFQRQVSSAERDGTVSPIDLDADLRQPKSSAQITKRTRFEDQPEMPTLEQLQSFHCAPVSGSSKNTFVYQEPEASADISSLAATQKESTFDQPLQHPDLSAKYKYMDTSFSAPSEPFRSSSSMRRSAPTRPPLSILEGFKVNKKGKILDEEGEEIGELVEGDLLDCVRQKANSRGEVIDDYGRVVGIVRTVYTVPEPIVSPRVAPTTSPRMTPTMSPKAAPMQESQAAPPASPVDSAPIKPALSTRVPNAPSLRTFATPPEVVQQALINVPSPIAESPSVDRAEPAQPLVADAPSSQIEEPKQVSAHVQGPQSYEELPKQVSTTSRDFATSEQPRRASLPRSESERSLSELSKPWAKSNMTSVPEHDVPEDTTIPDSPGLYAFKGEVPVDDRPQREARSRSPHVAINAKAALALGQPNSTTGPYGHNNRMGPRRATTHFAGSYSNGTLLISPSNKPYKPSPLSSQETSPKRSDDGDNASEDGTAYYSKAASRAPSVAASVYSVATSTSKPRTYFTHSGKITVNESDGPKPVKAQAKVPEVPTIPKDTAGGKKKSRLSMSFGRKTAAK